MPTNHFRVERHDYAFWPVASKLVNTARIRVYGVDAGNNQAAVTFNCVADKAKVLPPPRLGVSGGEIFVPQSAYSLIRDLLRWEEQTFCYFTYDMAELNAWISTVEDEFHAFEGPQSPSS